MHEFTLLEILGAGFALALVFGYMAKRLNLSPIVGYLLAGFLIGPNMPGFVADMSLAGQLSEAGVILLMFGVGLHFNTDDLLAVKGVAVPGAIIQASVATALGTLVAVGFGMPLLEGMMLGMGLAVASTVVLLRVLEDAHVVDTVHGHVAVGWLVVEDIITVLILVLLPSLGALVPAAGDVAAGGGLNVMDLAWAFGLAIVRLVALWVLVMVVGGKVVPWLLVGVARTRSQELFTLAVLMAAFATAVGAALFFHASVALGAFLAGMVIGKTKLSHKAGADILPLRDAFAVLFFLSVGMLFDPGFLSREPFLILCCVLIVLVAKPLTAMIVVTLLGYSVHTALTVAIGLAQVGEFSFILAQQAQDLGMITSDVYSILVVCAIVSITFNPTFFSRLAMIEEWLKKHPRLYHALSKRADARARRASAETAMMVHHGTMPTDEDAIAIIVGFGPTGRTVSEALQSHGLTPVVIDLNVDTVKELVDSGAAAVYGDSGSREILEAAGITRARYLVITVPDINATISTAALARTMNETVRILVRARFLNENKILRNAGVTEIAFEEHEIGRALTELALADVKRN